MLADTGHQLLVKRQVMVRQQNRAEHLASQKQVSQIGATVFARQAGTGLIQG